MAYGRLGTERVRLANFFNQSGGKPDCRQKLCLSEFRHERGRIVVKL